MDEEGKYMDGLVPELRGLQVLEEGNPSVLNLLSKCCDTLVRTLSSTQATSKCQDSCKKEDRKDRLAE